LFVRKVWSSQWRNCVFDYDHYHSAVHEVLGFAVVQALLGLGGPGGRKARGQSWRHVLLPAGTGSAGSGDEA
jgi:uncharacterized protein YjlB